MYGQPDLPDVTRRSILFVIHGPNGKEMKRLATTGYTKRKDVTERRIKIIQQFKFIVGIGEEANTFMNIVTVPIKVIRLFRHGSYFQPVRVLTLLYE